jgi:hypothetical protein
MFIVMSNLSSSAIKLPTLLLGAMLSLAIVPLKAQAPKVEQATINDYPTVPGRWSPERINAWYDAQPWLIGCNYYPASAINQIDMWQAATFDPATIDKELGWAAGLGMNTLRVFLHDLVWADDEQGLYARMDQFLAIAQKHGMRPWFVFFDDCHYPNPQLGSQPLPIKAFHNSGWVNSPSRALAVRYANGKASLEEIARLKGYVQKTIARFKDDPRVLLWELYNEPGRGNSEGEPMEGTDSKGGLGDLSKKLVYDSWVWAREITPSQPITSTTVGSIGELNGAINRANSDLYSVHAYSPPAAFEKLILNNKKNGRPVLMTEWLNRHSGNTPEACLPIMKKHRVAAINWGLVSGKSATIWPWTSRNGRSPIKERAAGNVVRPGEPFPEPDVWFHDLLRPDGTPYRESEAAIFRALTAQ